MQLFAGEKADKYLVRNLDGLSAVYHHASGITHIVSDPVPEILAVSAGKCLSMQDIFAALQQQFEIADNEESRAALQARLDELCEVGLVAST